VRLSQTSRRGWLDDGVRLVMWLGIVLYAVETLLYLQLGQFNGDEGWYLYGSTLVLQGLLPYRDFAYTQMPLLPYVYGVLQSLGPSLLVGRLTSVAISLGAAGMSVAMAKRYAGAWGGAFAALFLAGFSFGIYFNAIVKTYALVSFCFIATLFVLSSDLKDNWKYPVALLYAFGAAMVRISAVFFVAPVLLYALVAAPRRARAIMIAESAAAGLLAGFFLLPSWPAARWALISSHMRHWGPTTLAERVVVMLTERPLDILQSFGPVVVLSIAALYFVFSERLKPWQRDPRPLVVSTLGLALFAASHLANGIWATEYLVPAVTALLPVLAIALGRWKADIQSGQRSLVRGALVAVAFILLLQEGTQHLDLRSAAPPLAEIDRAAIFVATNSQPTEPVLALEGLGIAFQAGRSTLPGLTLAQFSLQNVEDGLAQELHVVNPGMLVDAVNAKRARVVILTEGDWSMLKAMSPTDADALARALDEQYRLALTLQRFGQFESAAKVYLSR
jgi:hypothetical protein